MSDAVVAMSGLAVGALPIADRAFRLACSGELSIIATVDAAQALIDMNQHDAAARLYRLWLSNTSSPQAYVAQFNLGVLLEAAHDDNGAEQAYRTAMEMNAGFRPSALNLAVLLERTNRIMEAQTLRLEASRSESPPILQRASNEAASTPLRGHLEAFDALRGRVIFALWLGPHAMSSERAVALQSIFRDSESPVCFITDKTLSNWEHPEHRFHPAFSYLSEVHRADYLRCYLMHHFGGGYTDIKPVLNGWSAHFDVFDDDLCLALGYPEVSASAVAQLPGELGEQLRQHYAELIGYCSMIFRRRTNLTSDWMTATNDLLDSMLVHLQNNPAQHPMDQCGVTLPSGHVSNYPLAWTELGGNIFHPLIMKYRHQVAKRMQIMPQLYGYR